MIPSAQYWLAEVEGSGRVSLSDGPHDTRSRAEQALVLCHKLKCVPTEGRKFVIATVTFSEPTGVHDPVNQNAIDVLNGYTP